MLWQASQCLGSLAPPHPSEWQSAGCCLQVNIDLGKQGKQTNTAMWLNSSQALFQRQSLMALFAPVFPSIGVWYHAGLVWGFQGKGVFSLQRVAEKFLVCKCPVPWVYLKAHSCAGMKALIGHEKVQIDYLEKIKKHLLQSLLWARLVAALFTYAPIRAASSLGWCSALTPSGLTSKGQESNAPVRVQVDLETI